MLELEEYWRNLPLTGKIKFVLKIILVILSILFAVFNWQSVHLHLIFLKVYVPLTLLIAICVGIGLIISSIFDYKRFKNKDQEIHRLKRELEEEKLKEY